MKTNKKKLNNKLECKTNHNNKTKRFKKGGRVISQELFEEEIQLLMTKLTENLNKLIQNKDLTVKTVLISNKISKYFNKIIKKINKVENIYPQYYNNINDQIIVYLEDFIETIKDTNQIIIDGFIFEIENYIIENESCGWNYEKTIIKIKKKMNEIKVKKANYLIILNIITQLLVNNNINNVFTEQINELNVFYDYINEYYNSNKKLLEEKEEGEEQNIIELESRWKFWNFPV